MIFIIQIPLLDSRALFKNIDDRPLYAHFSPLLEDQHFIKYVGKIRKRTRGGIGYFNDELFFVETKRLIKFDNLDELDINGISNVNCIFRRILFNQDGCVRLEVGFQFMKTDKVKIELYDKNLKLVNYIKEFLNIKIKVRSNNGYVSTILRKCDSYIVNILALATKQKKSLIETKQGLKTGSPLVWITNENNIPFSMPANRNVFSLNDDNECVYNFVSRIHARNYNIVFSSGHIDCGVSQYFFRQFRISFFRIHAEIQFTKLLLSDLSKNEDKFDTLRIILSLRRVLALFLGEIPKLSLALSKALMFHNQINGEELRYLTELTENKCKHLTENKPKNTSSDLIDEFQSLILVNKLDQAIDLLITTSENKDFINNLLLIKNRLYYLYERHENQLISNDQFEASRSRLVFTLIRIKDEI